MKQLIVMIATIILGVAIAALVLSFKGQAGDLATAASTSITNLMTGF